MNPVASTKLGLALSAALLAACGKSSEPTQTAPRGEKPELATSSAPPPGWAPIEPGKLQVAVPETLKPSAAPATAYVDPQVSPTAGGQRPNVGQIAELQYIRPAFRSKGVERALRAHAFAVDGNRSYREFFQLYENNRYRPILVEERVHDDEYDAHRKFVKAMPSVVTPDVVLHTLHLFFDFLLAEAEQESLTPLLSQTVKAMIETTRHQYRALGGTAFAKATGDNLVFLTVGLALLESSNSHDLPGDDNDEADDDEADYETGHDSADEIAALKARSLANIDKLIPRDLPVPLRDRAEAEFRRVIRAEGSAAPTSYSYPGAQEEDYTQYTVRGHYIKTPRLQAYFRAMMWFGRITLHFSDDDAARSALLLYLAAAAPAVAASWSRIFDTISLLVGPPDDVSFYDLAPLVARVYGAGDKPLTALLDEARFAELKAALRKLPPPAIQGVVTRAPHGPAVASTLGLHFFSQRSVLDARIFQALVDPRVAGRVMVSALELPEVLGSAVAGEILKPEALMKEPAYREQHAELTATIPALLARRSAEELYSGWLHCLQPLIQSTPSGYPWLMQSSTYGYLRLNSFMASYAELKHDTVLYAKQAATEMGGPSFKDTEIELDTRGYVIPEITLYARVHTLLGALRTGLEARSLMPAATEKSLQRLELLVAALVEISRKELEGAPLTAQEYHLIEFIGGDLEHFWKETLISAGGDRDALLDDNNAQMIADIFTGPGAYLHVATGYVHPVYVVFSIDGRPRIGRGGVMSYYEQVLSKRMNDREWREQLPGAPRPAWTKKFLSAEPLQSMDYPQGMYE